MNDLVSVVIPVYNVEAYLERCVDSVVRQSYAPLEILLIDDGATDRSGQICDELADRYDNVKVFHKKNGGLGDARNYGVRQATGVYVVFIDSDDWVEKNYVANLYRLLKDNNADLAITRLKPEKTEDCSPSGSETEEIRARTITGREAMIEIYSRQGLGWTACGKMFKREQIARFPFPFGYYEDCAMMYKLLLQTERVAVGEDVFDYHYISHSGSILRSPINEKHFRIFEICDEFDAFVAENCPELDYLTVILKRSAVTQMLFRQEMDADTYDRIFKKYRSEFRKNLPEVLRLKTLSKKSKLLYALHCTEPFVLKWANKLHSA